LALAIRAVLQTERAELFFRDFAAPKLLGALLKPCDLRFNGFAAVPFFDFTGSGSGHKVVPPIRPLDGTFARKIKKAHLQFLWHVGFGT